MSMHTVKKDSWNRTLSAVGIPKAFDRSNAPIYGFECQFAHGDTQPSCFVSLF